jgi:hypothetical protein
VLTINYLTIDVFRVVPVFRSAAVEFSGENLYLMWGRLLIRIRGSFQRLDIGTRTIEPVVVSDHPAQVRQRMRWISLSLGLIPPGVRRDICLFKVVLFQR